MDIEQLYDDHILYKQDNDLILDIVKFDKWSQLLTKGYSDEVLMLWFKNDNIIFLFKNGRKIDLSQLNILWLYDNNFSQQEKDKIKKLLSNTKIYF